MAYIFFVFYYLLVVSRGVDAMDMFRTAGELDSLFFTTHEENIVFIAIYGPLTECLSSS